MEWYNELILTETQDDYLFKVNEEDEETVSTPIAKKKRDVAWVRKHNYKHNQIRNFYVSFSAGDYETVSKSLKNYYIINDKKDHIRRIEGKCDEYTWTGPKWGKCKKKTTNKRIRQVDYDNIINSKSRYMLRYCSPWEDIY